MSFTLDIHNTIASDRKKKKDLPNGADSKLRYNWVCINVWNWLAKIISERRVILDVDTYDIRFIRIFLYKGKTLVLSLSRRLVGEIHKYLRVKLYKKTGKELEYFRYGCILILHCKKKWTLIETRNNPLLIFNAQNTECWKHSLRIGKTISEKNVIYSYRNS